MPADRAVSHADSFTILDVVRQGLCVGCGACAAVSPNIEMQFVRSKVYLPMLDHAGEADLRRADDVCPLSDSARNESEIADQIFPGQSDHYSENIGYFNYLAIGHIADDRVRLGSSSGGLTSWMVKELLLRNLIDGVIHVGSDAGSGSLLSEYVVSESIDALYGRRKSQYFPHELSAVINGIRGNGKRYGIVGLPCVIKAARNLAARDAVLGKQLKYFVGIVCGHLKSGAFAEYLAWQIGVSPSHLKQVDFRVKVEHDNANGYRFGAADAAGDWKYKRMSSIYGGDWGTTFFQLKACEYCDDIVAETADICFGDAWLKHYTSDWLGNNVIVCRNTLLRDLLAEGEERGELVLDPAGEQMVVDSQAGSFRQRRDGLSIRLEDARRCDVKMPRKRVMAGSRRTPFLFKTIIRCRSRIAALSHEAYLRAKDANCMDAFEAEMRPLTARLYRINSVRNRINRVRNLARWKYWMSLRERLLRR